MNLEVLAEAEELSLEDRAVSVDSRTFLGGLDASNWQFKPTGITAVLKGLGATRIKSGRWHCARCE